MTVQGPYHKGGLFILLDVPRFSVGDVGFPLSHAAKDEFIFFRVKWCPPSEGLIFGFGFLLLVLSQWLWI